LSKHKYLLKKDVRDERDFMFHDNFKAIENLPVSVDLTSKLPAIYQQGSLGSCQSQAIDSIVSFLHNNDFDPSRLFTYYNVRKSMGEEYISQDCGGNLKDTCDSVAHTGVCDSKYWEYDITKFAEQPPQIAYDNSTKDEIYTYHRVTSIDEVEQALAQGHLVFVGVEISDTFESDKCMQTGIVPKASKNILGGHALVICSYTQNTAKESEMEELLDKIKGKSSKSKGNFTLRNSWGTGLGLPDKNGVGTGYFQVSYEIFEEMVMDMWVIIK